MNDVDTVEMWPQSERFVGIQSLHLNF